MDKAVTVGQIFGFILGVVGILGFIGAFIFILSLLNPFRSGH